MKHPSAGWLLAAPLLCGWLPAQTFTEQVAPILFEHCATCHRPGEAAPFPLLTYEDARRKARMIARVTERGLMPPWHAAAGEHRFVDERRLSAEQIATLRAWVDNGTPEGPAEALPPLPESGSGWQLGEPDLVLTMREAFEAPAAGPDIYRNFVLPIGRDEELWIRAIELRPSARSVVHHVLYFADTTGRARELDGRDGRPGFRGMGFGGRRGDTSGPGWGQLGGWAVGMTPQFWPQELALPLPKGADLVLQTHFHPSGKAEREQTTVGIHLARKKPARTLAAVQIPPVFGALHGIDIPAGERDYVVRDSFTLPIAIEALSVGGHAHYLCTSMQLTAVLPDGASTVLLEIPRWDFAWQDRYHYEQPVALPAGTRLDAELHYDNSADNPANPHVPPQRVRWGRESEDEMGSITLQLVAADETELPQLHEALRAQLRAGGARGIARAAQAQIARLDRNADGELTADEVPPRYASLLRRFDANADGKLDQQELAKLRAEVGGR